MSAQPPIDAHLRELVARVQALAGAELVGVYAGGSYALGAYDPDRSDVDVAAVMRSPAGQPLKEAIVEAIRHESLPCPARGLEFVLYSLAAVREPTTAASFELNLNSGADMAFRADFEPAGIQPHWFPIDRSILAQCGVVLSGPPAGEVFALIPRGLLVPVVLESVKWHRTAEARDDDAVLNACRAWRYAIEGVWSSKAAAGAWAMGQPGAPKFVVQARSARHRRLRLGHSAVDTFLATVIAEIERAGEGFLNSSD